MRVVVFGTYDAAVHPRAAVLVDGLVEHGLAVTEVNAPLRLGTADKVAILQQPWRLPFLVGRLVSCWVRILGRSWLAGGADVVLVPYLGHFDVLLARARWPRRRIVLDHLVSAEATARDRGERGGPKLGLLRALDRVALRAGDIVVVDTHESAERLPVAVRDRALVIPVGATSAWFEAGCHARTRRMDVLRTVFFGSFTPLQGTRTIARALSRLPEGLLSVTLIGTGQDHDDVYRLLDGRVDITWRDWVTPDELPAVVADHDVCLGIFGSSDKALSVVPTKVYQGLAAGCALVTSDTPPQRRALGTAAVFVPPANQAALADALMGLAANLDYVGRLRAASLARARDFNASSAVGPLAAALLDEGPNRATTGDR